MFFWSALYLNAHIPTLSMVRFCANRAGNWILAHQTSDLQTGNWMLNLPATS